MKNLYTAIVMLMGTIIVVMMTIILLQMRKTRSLVFEIAKLEAMPKVVDVVRTTLNYSYKDSDIDVFLSEEDAREYVQVVVARSLAGLEGPIISASVSMNTPRATRWFPDEDLDFGKRGPFHVLSFWNEEVVWKRENEID